MAGHLNILNIKDDLELMKIRDEVLGRLDVPNKYSSLVADVVTLDELSKMPFHLRDHKKNSIILLTPGYRDDENNPDEKVLLFKEYEFNGLGVGIEVHYDVGEKRVTSLYLVM